VNRFAPLAQRLPGHFLHLSQLGLRAPRVALEELRRQLGLESDQGERVAEQVMQVAGDA
jgi:hypothetical protein